MLYTVFLGSPISTNPIPLPPPPPSLTEWEHLLYRDLPIVESGEFLLKGKVLQTNGDDSRLRKLPKLSEREVRGINTTWPINLSGILWFIIWKLWNIERYRNWICLRVVPLDRPWNGHQPLWVFDFLISVLNIWNAFKALSCFIQKLIQPPACSYHSLYRILSS